MTGDFFDCEITTRFRVTLTRLDMCLERTWTSPNTRAVRPCRAIKPLT